MYLIYILCFVSAVVCGNEDDTKYIDLLPEAEKEEFLNRIARRIIEEIQSTDSPQQSQTELSDDQLNQHHAYVQDLIKEESENLRNERKYNVGEGERRVGENDELEKDNDKTIYKPENYEKKQHLDLTLRSDREKKNNKSTPSDDSAFSVIPVKIIYDHGEGESTQSPSNISDGTEATSVLEQKDSVDFKNSSYTNIDSNNDSSVPQNFTERNETYNKTIILDTHIGYKVSEDQSNIILDNDIKTLVSSKQNLSHNLVNSTEIQSTTDTQLTKETSDNAAAFEDVKTSTQIESVTEEIVKNFRKENSDDAVLENVESSTQIASSTDKNLKGFSKEDSNKSDVLENVENSTPILSSTDKNLKAFSKENSNNDALENVENSTQIFSSTDKNLRGFSKENGNNTDALENVESSTQIVSSTNNILKGFRKENDNNIDVLENVENSTQIVSSTHKNSKGFSNETSDNGNNLGNVENSTQIYPSSLNNTVIKDKTSTESNIELTTRDSTVIPQTTETNTKYKSNMSEHEEQSTTDVFATTTNKSKESGDKKKEIDGIKKMFEEEGRDKMKKDIKDTVTKKYLRTKLETERNIKRNKKNRDENKSVREYIVYEFPKQKAPIFVELKSKKEIEQPYVVPIYNFAPENAYYNSYNQFGLNNNEEDEVVEKYKNPSDTEPYLRSGFKIELNPKNKDYRRQDKKDWMKYSHWQQVLQSKFDNNHYNTGKNDENWRRKFKRDNGSKDDDQWPDIAQIPNKIVYLPLRTRNGDSIYDRESEPINHRNNYKAIIYRSANNHVNDLKRYLYQKQRFGYLSPSRIHPAVKITKRTLEEEESKRKKHKTPKIDIELDYYFGKFNDRNGTSEVFSNEQYVDEDIGEFKGEENEKYSKVDMKPYRSEKNVDCKHGCLEMDLHTLKDNFDDYFEGLVRVLKDMIYKDNRDLVNYGWLQSTVDLRSAIKKIKDLTDSFEKGNTMHPLDRRLLNYILFLYNTSSSEIENTIQSKKHLKAVKNINYILNSFLNLLRRSIMPKDKQITDQKTKNNIRFSYKYYDRNSIKIDLNNREIKNGQELSNFKTFLNDIEDNLFELHDAIKHISLVTTYMQQNWYKDLKNIYLKTASKKQLLQVILHLAASRLCNAIEKTAQNAEEDELYVKKNKEVVRRIQEEFVFVLRILKQLKKIK